LVTILVILNLLDFVTTFIAIEYLDVSEANPILAYLMEVTGTIWVILWYKIVVIGGFLTLPYIFIRGFYERFQKRDVQTAFIILNIFYMAVVISNTYNIIVLLP